MLLSRAEVNPSLEDMLGRTALSWAFNVRGIHIEVVALLLARDDVNTEHLDASGSTPFTSAASHGRKKLVALFLARRPASVNAVDARGRTPLACAVIGGKRGVVGMLLDHDEVDVGIQDSDGGLHCRVQ